MREIVETRHGELRHAYPDIRGMAYGKRSRGQVTVADECVTFLVASKWRGEGPPGRSKDRLPEYLWTYAPTAWSSERVLCAVPTDVESEEDGRPVPHGAGIDMSATGRPSPWFGTVTCAVRLPNDPDLHALTCYHVAAMPNRDGGVPDQPRARLRSDGSPLGSTWWRWTGNLVRPPGESFDAAIVRVRPEHIDTLRRTVTGFRASVSLPREASIPAVCQILVPDREPVEAVYKQTWIQYDQIGYFDTGPQPVQTTILEFEIDRADAALGGDSGSAVVNRDGWQFVGMYLAGEGKVRRFVLPAYHLVDGNCYGNSGTVQPVPAP